MTESFAGAAREYAAVQWGRVRSRLPEAGGRVQEEKFQPGLLHCSLLVRRPLEADYMRWKRRRRANFKSRKCGKRHSAECTTW